jgi:hypothetical protein
VKFVGSFSTANAEFVNGTLTVRTLNFADYDHSAADSATNFVKGNVAFVGTFTIPNRHDLQLSLSASNPAFEATVFTGQFDDGTNTIMIGSDSVSKTVTVSSATGVSMRFSKDLASADVLKNNSKIATINRDNGIINYNDGTFESLK